MFQERQRLETILNLCAEYNKGENVGLDPLGSARSAFPGGVLTDGSGQRPSLDNVLGGTSTSAAAAAAAASSATLRLAQRLRESDDENLKEECSSTESTHQEVRTPPALHNGDRQVRTSHTHTHTRPSLCMSPWKQHELSSRADRNQTGPEQKNHMRTCVVFMSG